MGAPPSRNAGCCSSIVSKTSTLLGQEASASAHASVHRSTMSGHHGSGEHVEIEDDAHLVAARAPPERPGARGVLGDPAGTHRAVIVDAGVLMARVTQGAHVGIWLQPEGRVLHADAEAGVALDAMVTLRARGWARLRFFEPI